MVHEGPARVFDCEEDAIAAIKGGKIVPGDVVVIRYEGPKGGPGMREMLNPTSAIAGNGIGLFRCSHHRRKVFRSFQRSFYRTYFSGSSSGRPHCSGRRRRSDPDQYSGKINWNWQFQKKNWLREKKNGSLESRR